RRERAVSRARTPFDRDIDVEHRFDAALRRFLRLRPRKRRGRRRAHQQLALFLGARDDLGESGVDLDALLTGGGGKQRHQRAAAAADDKPAQDFLPDHFCRHRKEARLIKRGRASLPKRALRRNADPDYWILIMFVRVSLILPPITGPAASVLTAD